MSENVATSVRAGARTIGDILLELGFVDQERLDAAFERQQVTGQPLGQVLVEVGAITRLELATALAEQWADPSSPGPRWLDDPRTPDLPRRVSAQGGTPAPPAAVEPSGLAPRVAALEDAMSELRGIDDEPYLAQLQDAVVELARRSAGSEAAAAELAERVEGTTAALARLQQLDVEAAATAQRLEAVAAGVEVAVHGLQGDVALIQDAVERVSVRIDDVAAAAAGSQAVEELRASLEDLAARTVGDPTLAERLDDVVARVDALPNASELGELRQAVAELAARPPDDPALADALQELRAVVEGQAPREIDPALSGQVDALARKVGELAGRPPGDPEAASRIAALQDRLDGLAAELTVRDGDAEVLAALTDSVSELGGRMEALAAVANASVDTDAVEALKEALDELAGRPAGDATTEARIDALVEHVALLPAATELHELREAVAELAARPSGDPDLAARVDVLAATIAGVDLGAISARVDELGRQLDAFEPVRPIEAERASELEHVQELLTEGFSHLEELRERVDGIESRVDAPGRDDEQQARLDDVAESLARLERALIELAESTPAGDRAAVGAVVDRISVLERDSVTSDDLERVASAVEVVRSEVHDRLTSVAGELSVLDGRVRGLGARPALEPEAEARVARIELQLGELASNVARHSAGERRVAGSALTGDAAEDIERIRMSIERLGHTIGEQGRAIAGLMKAQGGNEVLQRLTSRIEALEDGGVAAPAGEGGVPSAGLGTLTRRIDDTDAALEKLLTQLERMGSSLEWRFRRLEEMVGGG